jgi:hypothetical protein
MFIRLCYRGPDGHRLGPFCIYNYFSQYKRKVIVSSIISSQTFKFIEVRHLKNAMQVICITTRSSGKKESPTFLSLHIAYLIRQKTQQATVPLLLSEYKLPI